MIKFIDLNYWHPFIWSVNLCLIFSKSINFICRILKYIRNLKDRYTPDYKSIDELFEIIINSKEDH